MTSHCPYCASFANACSEVAGLLAARGLEDGVLVHGSAARMNSSHVQAADEMFVVSDLDVLILVDTQIELSPLADECTNALRRRILGCPTPICKVSLQKARDWLRFDEGLGVLRSAAAIGRPLSALRAAEPLSTVMPASATLLYPFALQHAALRWLMWAGTGAAADVAALYELAKATGRHLGDSEWSVGTKAHLISETDLRLYLYQLLPALSGTVLDVIASDVSQWMDGAAGNGLSLAKRLELTSTFVARLRSQCPSSLAYDRATRFQIGLRS